LSILVPVLVADAADRLSGEELPGPASTGTTEVAVSATARAAAGAHGALQSVPDRRMRPLCRLAGDAM
jgi:hypothetical protein